MNYLCFSTKASDRHERSNQWRAITRGHAELGDDREASIRGCDLGDLRLCSVALGQHRLENRTDGQLAGDDGMIKFLFVEEGECEIEQNGTSRSLGAGQWCAVDKTRPFYTHSSISTRQLALSVPRHRVQGWKSIGDRLMMPQAFLYGAGSVLHESAATAIGAAVQLGRKDRAQLGEALIHLLNVAWHADPHSASTRTRAARRRNVIDFVERNLSNPDLDVATIAEALGYSKRTLYKLFAGDTITLGRLIWARRLETCRQQLLDPAHPHRSITEIAHASGFSDSQHFSRAFKTRFGSSPREFRANNLPH